MSWACLLLRSRNSMKPISTAINLSPSSIEESLTALPSFSQRAACLISAITHAPVVYSCEQVRTKKTARRPLPRSRLYRSNLEPNRADEQRAHRAGTQPQDTQQIREFSNYRSFRLTVLPLWP